MKTIFFDFNGTIIDDLDLCFNILNQMLDESGKEQITIERYKDIFTFPIIEYYKKAGMTFENKSFEDYSHEFIAAYQEASLDCPLHEGIKDVFEKFHKLGYNLVCLSASQIDNLKEQLVHFKIDKYFDAILGISDVYAKSKVEIGLKYMKEKNIDPSSAIMIGDTLHDYEVSTKMGISCVLYDKGHQSRKVLEAAGVKIVSSHEEFYDYVVSEVKQMKVIINEDFEDFKATEFPYDHDHSALGEYHHVMPNGYTGSFYDPISLHQWRSLGGSWLITKAFGKSYLEQNRGDNASGHFKSVSAVLVHKKKLYAPYTLSFDMALFETKNLCGICFNYIHNRKYDCLAIDGTNLVIYHRNQEDVYEYYKEPFNASALDTLQFKLELGEKLNVYINEKYICTVDVKFNPGYIAFIAKSPCRYSDLVVSMEDNNYSLNLEEEKKWSNYIKSKQEQYPELKCIKKINLNGNGAGRQFRYGLDRNNQPVLLFAQHQKRMYRDAFARLSCLSAYNLDGQLLWQYGSPNPEENGPISCDLPFQIGDINGDGLNEVIFASDFMVYIVSLETGEIISKMKTPYVKGDPLVGDYPYDYLNPDGMRLADFEGLGYQGDFILKDRYKNVWAYRASDFKLLWRYNHKNTGHFPYIYDFNNDGCDEMLVGYDMVSSKGEILWSLPINSDHTDEIIYTNTEDGGEKRLYLASGNEGFNIVDINGNIIKSNDVGHAQRISVAPYIDNGKMQVAVTSFWGADMLMYLYDGDGNLISEREMMGNGNLVCPVAYDGKHNLILSNASPELGGLLDANLDVVVKFPDDGHPTLTAEVIDIDNDGVDEILVFDEYQLWIYKASTFTQGIIHKHYPDNAYSNYRGEYLVKKN